MHSTRHSAALLPAIAMLALAGCQRHPVSAGQAKTDAAIAGGESLRPTFRVGAGTPLAVRLDHSVSTRSHKAGDAFTATLAEPVYVDDTLVLRRGTSVSGRVVAAAPSGRLKGRAVLVLALTSIDDGSETYTVQSTAHRRVSRSHRRSNLTWIGGGSGAGAAVGALAGGGAGAAIGAGAGAAAGTAGALVTGRRHVSAPAETVVKFTLKEPVYVRLSRIEKVDRVERAGN
jgi:hypothetical protein